MIILDDYIPIFTNTNIFSLSANSNLSFKSIHSTTSSDYVINWGEPVMNTSGAIIETGFFKNGAHIDRFGLYQHSSLNFEGIYKRILEYNPPISTRSLFDKNIINYKFHQGNDPYYWSGVVLATQHLTDRSIQKTGGTSTYLKFIDDACRFYGKNLFIKLHPINNGNDIQIIKTIADRYGVTCKKTGINIFRDCQFILTYNSTIAVDCFLNKKPIAQYAPGYFWKSGATIFTDGKFPTTIPSYSEYQDKFLDFIMWKYCFNIFDTPERLARIFSLFENAVDDFPLTEELSYGGWASQLAGVKGDII